MTSPSKDRRVPGRMLPPPAHRLAPGGPNVRTDEQSWHCRRYRNRLILPALSAYRSRLNKAFTIEIERPLSIRAWLPPQALSPSLRSLGRMSLNRSNTFTACAACGPPFAGAPHRVVTVGARGVLTRSVNIDWKDGRRAAGGGSCSLARASACVVPAVSGVGANAGGVGIGAGGIGGTAEAMRMTRAGTSFTGFAATVTGGGNGGAAPDRVTTGWVTPPCANATVCAESKRLVSLP